MTAVSLGSRAIRGRSVCGFLSSPISDGRGMGSRPVPAGEVTIRCRLTIRRFHAHSLLPTNAEGPQNVCRSLFDGLVQFVGEGNRIDSRLTQSVPNLGVLIFEREIYDRSELRACV